MSEQNQQPASTILTNLLTIATELWYALDAIYAADLVPESDDDSRLLRTAEAIITQAHATLNRSPKPSTPCCPCDGSPLQLKDE